MTIPRFTNDQILEMRTRYRDGELQTTIMVDYGIKQSMISQILGGRCYKNIPWPLPISSGPERRKHPTYPGYEFDDQGNVYSFKYNRRYGRQLKLQPDSDKGYLMTGVVNAQGKPMTLRVNRIICTLFNGLPLTPSHQAMHLNSIKTDNRAINLSWGTQKENEDMKDGNGNRPVGEKVGSAKLNADKVREIRASNKSGRELARQYKVSQPAICQIISRKTWKHVS